MSKKRKRTELGREIAKLRIDFNETGAEMADKLGVSPSNLFNIETGATNVPYKIIATIKEVYGKDLDQIYLSGGAMSEVKIQLDELGQEERQLALQLWRKANGMAVDAPIMNTVTVPSTSVTVKKAPATPTTPPLPDDVGFIDELSDDELDEIDLI